MEGKLEIIDENNIDEERNYTVYMHTSPSGKVYIGITGQNPPEKRWLNGRGYNQNPYFKNAIQKYGFENFSHEILFSGLTKEEAGEKEIELIKEYNSTNREFGYNIQNGGQSIGVFTEETKIKMSDSHKMIDVYWTRTPICQYSKEGVFIKKWESEHAAGLNLGIEPSSIGQCCNGIVKLSGGYIFKKENEELTKEEIEYRNSSNRYAPNKKEVCQYDMSGNFIKKYDNILLAAKESGANHAVIIRCCNGVHKSSGGYIWRYSYDEITEDYIKWCNTRFEDKKRKVKQFSLDGEFIAEYNSASDIANIFGYSRSAIGNCCGGKQQTSYGYIWRYADEC